MKPAVVAALVSAASAAPRDKWNQNKAVPPCVCRRTERTKPCAVDETLLNFCC